MKGFIPINGRHMNIITLIAILKTIEDPSLPVYMANDPEINEIHPISEIVLGEMEDGSKKYIIVPSDESIGPI